MGDPHPSAALPTRAPHSPPGGVGFYTAPAIEVIEDHPPIRLAVERLFARRAEPYIG